MNAIISRISAIICREKYLQSWSADKCRLLLWIYQTGELSFPTFVALAGAIFTTLAENLSYYTNIVANMGYHIKAYEYYDRFFNLSEETYGEAKEVPKDCSIAFEDVCFTYPGTDRQVLSHYEL